jgi:hypothetical protein
MINEHDNKDDDYKDDDFDEEATIIDEEEIIPDESDTSVIALTCHGRLNPSKYNYIVIPEGFEVVKINTSYLGCVTYSNRIRSNDIIKIISQKYKELLSEYNNIFEKAIDDIISIIERQNESLGKEIKKNPVNYDYFETEYLRRNRESIYVEYLKPGDRVINKLYSRHSNEKEDYYFSIPVISEHMNVNTHQDLLSEIGRKIFDIEAINLENIIDYFISIGKTKLVMFDITCSVFQSGDERFDPRSTRATRRNIIRDENIDIDKKTKRPRYRGGKYKNKSRKNKSRKNKSRKNKSRKNKSRKNKSRKNKNKLGKK